jgi:hypothetical protein
MKIRIALAFVAILGLSAPALAQEAVATPAAASPAKTYSVSIAPGVVCGDMNDIALIVDAAVSARERYRSSLKADEPINDAAEKAEVDAAISEKIDALNVNGSTACRRPTT